MWPRSARIQLLDVPVSKELEPYLAQALGRQCTLAGGDDYELCFTAPVSRHKELKMLATQLALPLSCIGKIEAGAGYEIYAADGSVIKMEEAGYAHFK